VLHYGHACLSPVSRIPVKFIFRKSALDVADCSARILHHLSADAIQHHPVLLVMYDLEYAHAMPALQAALDSNSKSTSSSVPNPTTPQLIMAQVSCTEAEPHDLPGSSRYDQYIYQRPICIIIRAK
jgi:diphthamide biosynthesis protein 2